MSAGKSSSLIVKTNLQYLNAYAILFLVGLCVNELTVIFGGSKTNEDVFINDRQFLCHLKSKKHIIALMYAFLHVLIPFAIVVSEICYR